MWFSLVESITTGVVKKSSSLASMKPSSPLSCRVWPPLRTRTNKSSFSLLQCYRRQKFEKYHRLRMTAPLPLSLVPCRAERLGVACSGSVFLSNPRGSGDPWPKAEDDMVSESPVSKEEGPWWSFVDVIQGRIVSWSSCSLIDFELTNFKFWRILAKNPGFRPPRTPGFHPAPGYPFRIHISRPEGRYCANYLFVTICWKHEECAVDMI